MSAQERDALIELLESSQHAPMNDHVPDPAGNPECVSCPWPLHALDPAAIADVILAAGWSRPVPGGGEVEAATDDVIERARTVLEDHRLIAARCRCGFDPRLDHYRHESHVLDALAAAGLLVGGVPARSAIEDDLRSRLSCVIEITGWDRPYDTRLDAIRGMCDLTTDGMTPKES